MLPPLPLVNQLGLRIDGLYLVSRNRHCAIVVNNNTEVILYGFLYCSSSVFCNFESQPYNRLKRESQHKKIKQASSAVVQRGPNQASHDAVLLFHPGLRAPTNLFNQSSHHTQGFLIEVQYMQKLGSAAGYIVVLIRF